MLSSVGASLPLGCRLHRLGGSGEDSPCYRRWAPRCRLVAASTAWVGPARIRHVIVGGRLVAASLPPPPPGWVRRGFAMLSSVGASSLPRCRLHRLGGSGEDSP